MLSFTESRDKYLKNFDSYKENLEKIRNKHWANIVYSKLNFQYTSFS